MKPSFHHPPILVCGLALLIAACGMLLATSRAQAASNRGAVLVKDIRPGHAGGIQIDRTGGGGPQSQLANVNDTLYFSTDDGKHGYELWRSNGTVKGTRMVKDINPGAASSYPLRGTPSSGTPFYFVADDGVHGVELWRSDGTRAGTLMVKDLAPGTAYNGVDSLTNVGGTLYFGDWPPAPGAQPGLWRSDGTEAGTTLVKQVVDFQSLIDVNGTLYFGGAGNDPGFKIGLWRSDGTTAGTTAVKDIGPGVPGEITDVNGTLFFRASDFTHGYELWRSDGTEAGTVMVKDINPGAGATVMYNLTNINGSLYFMASSSVDLTLKLWRSDGTEAGTTQVTDLNDVRDLTAFKGRLSFLAEGGLWRSDGTPGGTTLVRGNCCFSQLTRVGGTLYLAGGDKRHGTELWRSDGTRKGTGMVRNIRPGRAGSLPQHLTAVDRTLFFSAKDGRHGRELWKVGPKPCKTVKGKCKKG